MNPYYDDHNCTIYKADWSDVLSSLDRFDLLLTEPPQYERGLSDENRIRMDSGLRLAPQSNRILPLPEAELLLAIDKCDNAIVWRPDRYRLPGGKKLEWFCNGPIATAWHNIPAPRVGCWGPIPASQRHGLLKRCIQFTPIAQTILDPFMGAGDVLAAAMALRRRFVGIEIDEQRCDEAINRIREHRKDH